MSDSPVQSLIDGLLNSAQVPKEDRSKFAPDYKTNANAGDVAKILDLFARMPSQITSENLPQKPGKVLKGMFEVDSRKTRLDKNAADLETLIHEGIHVIDKTAFTAAMNEKAPSGSDLAKFQDKIIKVLGSYQAQYASVLEDKKANPHSHSDSQDAYTKIPAERLAFAASAISGNDSNLTSAQKDRNSSALADLRSLIDLLPDKFKMTQKQLSRGY